MTEGYYQVYLQVYQKEFLQCGGSGWACYCVELHSILCFIATLAPRRRPLRAPINSPELFAADIFSLLWRKCLPRGALMITRFL